MGGVSVKGRSPLEIQDCKNAILKKKSANQAKLRALDSEGKKKLETCVFLGVI